MLRYLYAFICIVMLPSCYAVRAYKARNFALSDLSKQTARTIAKSNQPFHFAHAAPNRHAPLATYLDSLLKKTDSYSFLVIQNDSIIYEQYFDGLQKSNQFPSFSVAKSFVATLAQMALQEGAIKSFDEPITHYLSFLSKKDKRFASITIRHLLDMRSGIKSNEEYNNPFSDVLKLGFTHNMQGKLKKLKIEKAPGVFEYKSVNTQLLAMVVEKATGKKLYNYVQEKLWQPLGMESDATWNTDSKRKDMAKGFCCLNATTHDFAKLGRLYLNNGNWNGQQLLDSNWVKATVAADTMRLYEGYKNQWWGTATYRTFTDSLSALQWKTENHLPEQVRKYQDGYFVSFTTPAYMAKGILGQYIYVNPISKLIIVRTGHYWGGKGISPENLFEKIHRMLENTQ